MGKEVLANNINFKLFKEEIYRINFLKVDKLLDILRE